MFIINLSYPTCWTSLKQLFSRITMMLISMVCLHFFLVCPSTVLSLLSDIITSKSDASLHAYQIAVVITNMAQASFFSMNFGLYCSISKRFRDSVSSQVLCKKTSGRSTSELNKNKYRMVAINKAWRQILQILLWSISS